MILERVKFLVRNCIVVIRYLFTYHQSFLHFVVEEFKMALALSWLSPARSNALAQDPEVRSMASSTQSEVELTLSNSEKVHLVSIEAGEMEDSPPLPLLSKEVGGCDS